jgi:hypothetical protein
MKISARRLMGLGIAICALLSVGWNGGGGCTPPCTPSATCAQSVDCSPAFWDGCENIDCSCGVGERCQAGSCACESLNQFCNDNSQCNCAGGYCYFPDPINSPNQGYCTF